MSDRLRKYYGEFGGRFIPEVLHTALEELSDAFDKASSDSAFWSDLEYELSTYSCRPTPLTRVDKLSDLAGVQIFIKREDLNHTGAHKLNNVIGQGLLAKRMGKRRVVAETGAGQHGVATATMAARFGLDCTVYMGEIDVERQYPNVFWMKQLGAQVVPVRTGTRILKDAISEALRDWSASMEHTHYVLGTACGPFPFPQMVAAFQSVIGREARQQILTAAGRLPSAVYACVGGGSNAVGIFEAFLDDPQVQLIACEGGGDGVGTSRHALPQVMVRWGYRTATRATSCSLRTVRCWRPFPRRRVSTMLVYHPSWLTGLRSGASASPPPPTARPWPP